MLVTLTLYATVLMQSLLGFYMVIKFTRESGLNDWKRKEIGIQEETMIALSISSVIIPIVGILISGYLYLKIKEMRKL